MYLHMSPRFSIVVSFGINIGLYCASEEAPSETYSMSCMLWLFIGGVNYVWLGWDVID